MPKVFSVTDFRRGLDTRRNALAAPPATLRILENALITPGGEIQKRHAFVHAVNITPNPWTMIGQFDTLHVFGSPTAPVIPPNASPVPIVSHALEALPGGVAVRGYTDVESFGLNGFLVSGFGDDLQFYNWWNGVLVKGADGVTPTHGTYSRTYKTKMYRTEGFALFFSGVDDPAQNDPSDTTNPGAGFIQVSKNDPDAEPPTALEIFYDKMAVFARLGVQIWSLDPDPTLDQLGQVLRVGTVAPQSVHQIGTGDVLFLSDSGIRSLKSSTALGFAGVADVGAPLDLILMPIVRDTPLLASTATAVLQPSFGRYWMHLNQTIYVLSYFPAGEITAWSTFTVPFQIDRFAVVGNNLAVQSSTGGLYWYGGPSRNEFDNTRVRVRTPHHDNEAPTENKRVKSIDVLCEGAWSVSAGMLPNRPDLFEPVANIDGNTFGLQSIPFAGYGTHVGLHLEHAAPGPATLAAIHLNLQEGWTK